MDMRIGKYGFILGLVIGALSIIACAKNQLPPSDNNSLLSAYANPALIGVKKLYVIIKPSDAKSDKDGLVWSDLQKQVEQKLQAVNLEIVPEQDSKDRDIPELRVSMDMLEFHQSQLYVFHLQLSFATKVYLKQKNVSFKAEVWKAEPVIQAVAVTEMSAKVTYAVLEQVDAFIRAYKLANQSVAQPLSDINDVNVVSRQQSNSETAKQAAEYKYVASKNGKVFHKSSCVWAKKITPENLVGYNSAAEAENAGKRPYKLCKP
jgi:hypothetical protein